MKAKLILVEVRADASGKDSTLGFYSSLFGDTLARSLTDAVESYHIPISRDGTWFTVGVRTGGADDPVQAPLPVVCHFAVDDLAAAVDELTSAGGRRVTDAVGADVSERARDYYVRVLKERQASDHETAGDGSFVKTAYVEDPGGNVIALTEVAEHSKGWFGLTDSPLTDEQIQGHHRTLEVGERFAAGETL
jgi:predicted enzyme related to lactoylglutathione lyase